MPVQQFRDDTDRIIKQNPQIVSFFSGNSLKTETVRISHERSSVPANVANPVGLGTSFSMYALMYDYSEITANTILIENGKGWKVGPVDSLENEVETYRKRAPLVLVALGVTKAITSFKIGSAIGVITGLNIAITVPTGTDVTALIPTILHNGKMISPVIAQDFTTPKTYTVTAENLDSQTYTVTVTVAP